jgi:hypothetical protein
MFNFNASVHHRCLSRFKFNYHLLALSLLVIGISGASSFIAQADEPVSIPPQPGGARSGAGVCVLSPGRLEADSTIWSDRPVFLWHTENPELVEMETIQLIDDTGEIVWEKPLSPNDEMAVYDGEPLQPGQMYTWHLVWNVEDNNTRLLSEQEYEAEFLVMSTDDRRTEIADELDQLTNGVGDAAIATNQAEFLAQQGLWSDAFGTLQTVEASSPEITTKLVVWTNAVCGIALD